MKVSNLLIGIAFFIIIIVGGFSWMTLNVDTTNIGGQELSVLNKSLARADKIQATAGNFSATLGTDLDSNSISTLGVLNSLIQTSWSTLKQIPDYLGFVNDMLKSLASILGVSDSTTYMIIGLLWAALVISVVFVVFGAIFQRDL